MYNLNYVYVSVKMDKADYALEQLIDELERCTDHLYRVERKDEVLYRGLCPVEELDRLFLLRDMSPYGNGYKIEIDGLPESEYKLYSWKVVRGIA